jgi:hypothetical protein
MRCASGGRSVARQSGGFNLCEGQGWGLDVLVIDRVERPTEGDPSAGPLSQACCLQDAATRCSERTCISRFTSMPVMTTRSPTWLGSFTLFAASTTSMDAAFFFRNPDFQLRDFGAFSPVVSLRRNASSSCSRHPVSVTGD